ncbi:MAG: transglutaminase domain-containing protein [Metamycoplasmataceae bacterium]
MKNHRKNNILFLNSLIVFATVIFSSSCFPTNFFKKNIDKNKQNNFDKDSQNNNSNSSSIYPITEKIARQQITNEMIKINEKEKTFYLNKINNILGKEEAKFSNSNNVVREWINTVNELKNKIIKVTNLVFEKYSFRENRYLNDKIAFLNFINNYLDLSNRSINKSINDSTLLPYKSWIQKVIQSINTQNFSDLSINYDFYMQVFKETDEYLNKVIKNFELVFDIEDAYYVDYEKLDFINKINSTKYLNKDYIFNLRKKLLTSGRAEVNNKPYSKPFIFEGDKNPDEGTNILDMVYDLTGGSNYFNDITFTKYFKNSLNNAYSFNFDYRTENAGEELEVDKLVRNVIPKIISKNFDDIKKIKAVHKWIVENTEYFLGQDNETNKYKIRSPYAFVAKTDVVCEGYARMFQKFMTFLNIPSWYITGDVNNSNNQVEGHAWNMVKVNNKYYFVDCTWDDPVKSSNIDKHNIHHKSIDAYETTYLLVPWSEFKNRRTISESLQKLHAQRKQAGKSYLDFFHITNS